PPICWLVLISPEASPASEGATWESAAIVTGTNPNASPSAKIRYGGSRSGQKGPSTGSWGYQTIQAARISRPDVITGRRPYRVVSAWAMPAQITVVPAVARKVTPVLSADHPSTCWT